MGNTTLDWADVATAFVPDGSLRDIYVHDVSLEDWQAALDAIRGGDFDVAFLIDSEAAALPERVADVFAVREEASVVLRVTAGKVRIHGYFFVDSEIEFDVDPREISSQEELDRVVQFMKLLAVATRKTAVLSHENAPSEVILIVSAASGISRVGSEGA